MFIDTHCHLDMIADRLKEKDQNQTNIQLVKKVIDEAFEHHVTRFITVGVDSPTNRNALSLATNISSVFAACGIHPCDATNNWQEQLNELKKLVQVLAIPSKLIAIGEIGLDFHHQPCDPLRQKDAFKAQIEFALSLNLPIIVHSRNAIEETLEVVDQFDQEGLKGVFHCFSEKSSYATEIIKRGFYLGVAGHVTYPKNDELRTALITAGLDHLLLETDAPFLPPQIIRGKMNTPAQVATIGTFIAPLFGVTENEISRTTTRNAEKLFSLSANSSTFIS